MRIGLEIMMSGKYAFDEILIHHFPIKDCQNIEQKYHDLASSIGL